MSTCIRGDRVEHAFEERYHTGKKVWMLSQEAYM